MEEQNYPISLSELVTTVHKIEYKVSKLYEVITGDKELGTDGLIVKNYKLEKRVQELENYKNKLAGIYIAAGVSCAFIVEIIKSFITKN